MYAMPMEAYLRDANTSDAPKPTTSFVFWLVRPSWYDVCTVAETMDDADPMQRFEKKEKKTGITQYRQIE